MIFEHLLSREWYIYSLLIIYLKAYLYRSLLSFIGLKENNKKVVL